MDEAGQAQTNIPYDKWLATLCLPRIQLKTCTSYEVRPIYDCTGSGLNWAVVVKYRMVMDDFDMLKSAQHKSHASGHRVSPCLRETLKCP